MDRTKSLQGLQIALGPHFGRPCLRGPWQSNTRELKLEKTRLNGKEETPSVSLHYKAQWLLVNLIWQPKRGRWHEDERRRWKWDPWTRKCFDLTSVSLMRRGERWRGALDDKIRTCFHFLPLVLLCLLSVSLFLEVLFQTCSRAVSWNSSCKCYLSLVSVRNTILRVCTRRTLNLCCKCEKWPLTVDIRDFLSAYSGTCV